MKQYRQNSGMTERAKGPVAHRPSGGRWTMRRSWIGGAVGMMLVMATAAGVRAEPVVTFDDRGDKISVSVTGLPRDRVRFTVVGDEAKGVTLIGVLPAATVNATEA